LPKSYAPKQSDERALQRALEHGRGFVREWEPLAPWTTWRIGGPARLFAQPHRLQQLTSLFDIVRAERLPWFFLGLGSNVLVSDEGFPGVVLHPEGELSAIDFEADEIVAGPMARLLDLTVFAAQHSLSGMETLCGIPGSVGGALYMNAGAFGAQVSDRLQRVELLSPGGDIQILEAKDIGFGYRTAPRLQEGIILRSWYALEKESPNRVWAAMRKAWKDRREKQPLDLPSAGSVFKRPPGDFAGRLIEAVGAKGNRIGGAMVSEKHANFFINVGHATAAEMAALIRNVRAMVLDRFGVLLELEVKPVGFAQDPFAIAQ
jgi:UDP-N-acetylmuramate dehydrogenase